MDDLFEEFADWLREDAYGYGDPPMGVQIPEKDASEREIAEYIHNVEEATNQEDDEEAVRWPLKNDAPVDAVRAYIEFLRNRLEAMKEHRTVD